VAAVTGADGVTTFDPVKGNVAFSCGLYTFSFTLESFANMYCNTSGAVFDPRELAVRLWGDVYFHKDSRMFRKMPPEDGGERSFVAVRLAHRRIGDVRARVTQSVHYCQAFKGFNLLYTSQR
jgi:hypothetical protein